MTLKIISLIFVIALAFGFSAPSQVKALPSRTQARRDVRFDVNNVINQVSPHGYPTPNPCPLIPDLTGEFLIDTNVVYIPALSRQSYPSIAFDETNYMVVWVDDRSGYSDIYCTRINQSGLILDTVGIPISTTIGYQNSPSISFDGLNYIVVWADERITNDYNIYGARINQFGVVLDTVGITISTAVNKQTHPMVIFGDSNYMVVWEDNRDNSLIDVDIYGARVSTSGVVLDPTGIPIATLDTAGEVSPSLAFDGTNYFVVWGESRTVAGIFGARVNQAGIVIDTTSARIGISIDNYARGAPSVAFDGTNYLVVWPDSRNSEYLDIYGARVTPQGICLDSIGFPVSTTVNYQRYPSITFDGSNYFVIWHDGRFDDIYGTRINQYGVVLDTTEILVSANASGWQKASLSVAFGQTDYLAVWTDEYNNQNILGARINQTGIVLDTSGLILSMGASSQNSSAIASDSYNYFVVWEDYRNGDYSDIYGARVSQAGVILDPVGIPISTMPVGKYYPSVAFDGSYYLVVWQDNRNASYDIYGARLNQAGVVLDPLGIPISTAAYRQSYPSVAFDGSNYLTVWTDDRNDCSIYGARVSQTGTVLEPQGIPISTAAERQFYPAVAFDGINYFVAWTDERNGRGNRDIYGARLDQSGIVLDTGGIPISTESHRQILPSITFDGTNYLVVWEDARNSSWDIYGARISPSGTVLDTTGIAICTTSKFNQNSSLAFDGSNFLVIWQEGYHYSSDFDIYGAKISPLGIVSEPFVISSQSGTQIEPAIKHGSGAQMLITYSGWIDSINHRPANTIRIWGKFYPSIGIAEQNSKVKMQTGKLLEVYPNPFKSQTVIRFSLSAPNKASLKIYDISGKLVKSFSTNNQQLTANNCFIWNGTDDSGKKLPAGVYICRLKTTEGLTQTKELIILR